MSLRRFIPPAALSLAACLAAWPALGAQAQTGSPEPLEGFAEEVSVEIVNVEVWVTDRQGRPVTGLTRDDFELREDGEPVEITNFAAYDEAAPSGSAEGGTAEPAAAAPAPGTAPSEGGENALHLAVLVDDWNLRPEDRARVLDALRAFLSEHVRPGDRVMVAVHDRALQLVQGFTADPRALVRSLEGVERGAPSGVALRNERRGALEAIREAWDRAAREVQLTSGLPASGVGQGSGTPGPCVTGWGGMENAARSYAAAVEGHVQRSAGALASLAQILSGVPGRKVLLYVGNGLEQQAGAELFHYLAEVCPDRQSEVSTYFSIYDLTWLFEEVARRANAGRITLYTLEAEAPVAGEDIAVAGPQGSVYRPEEAGAGDGGAAGGSAVPGFGGGGSASQSFGQTFRPSVSVRRQAELNREDSLVYMARETGGRAVLNAADFRDDFERIATDLRSHYSLGFSSSHRGDGRSHRLEVKVEAGDGYRVRHRRSYVAHPPEQRMAERIRGVAQFGEAGGPGLGGTAVGVVNPLGVRVETGEATAVAGGAQRVPLRLWVPLANVTLLPRGGEDGPRQGRLRVMMAVGDARGNLGPVRQKLVPVELRGVEDGEAAGREKLVEIQLDLDGELHVVALGVRDEVGGDISYLRHEVRLGAAPQARLEP